MTARPKPLHFALSAAQANAVLEVIYGLECLGFRIPERHPALSAANAISDQKAQQEGQWEVCGTCRGTGWVEE